MAQRHLAAATLMGRAILRGRIKYMILHVNSVCNAKCRFCFSWDGMQERWDPNGHSVENIRKLAASMDPLPQLTCSGGEPLLRKDLPEIIKAFYDLASTRFFTIPTNSLKPERVERMIDYFTEHCPKGFLNFCLPFHGEGEEFDEIMGVPGNFVKFNETYRIIQEKKKQHSNISCVLNFVMSKFNYQKYRSIIDMGAERYSESPLGIAYARGVTHERDATDVPVDIYREAQAYLAKRRRNHTRSNPYTLMFDTVAGQACTIVSSVVTGEVTDLACGAGKNFLVVYDNGAVYPCELLDVMGIPKPVREGEVSPEHTSLGNLNDFDYSMERLLGSDEARDLVNWIANHECACTWECAIYSKIVHSPKEIATLGTSIVKYMLKDRPEVPTPQSNSA